MTTNAIAIDGKDLLTRLNSEESNAINFICDTLLKQGFECYLVGGCVRDLILNHHSTGDIDLTSNATPQQIQKIFPHTVPTGIKHGTVTIVIKKIGYEITTYRFDSDYSDARRPDTIRFSQSLDEDLARRDFTINAICLSPKTEQIVDLHNGIDDIKNKIIRTIGDPKDRFFEDGLRPIRACRFKATLGFAFDKKLWQSLKDPQIHKRCKNIAIERFTDELYKGFRSTTPGHMIEALEKSNLLYLFIKKEQFINLITTGPIHIHVIDNLTNTIPEFKIAYWLQSINIQGDQNIKKVSTTLKLSRNKTDKILFLQKYITFQKEVSQYFESKTDSSALNKYSPELLYQTRVFLSSWKSRFKMDGLIILQSIPNQDTDFLVSKMIEIYKTQPLVITDLNIDGNLLQSQGLKGRQIGDALKRTLDYILRNPQDNQSKKLLKIALEIQSNIEHPLS